MKAQSRERSMTSDSISHIQDLIQSARLEEAKIELENLLRNTPGNGYAWTIAAQLTSELEQREEFLRRVFEYSDDSNLADWAFRNLGQALSDKPPVKFSSPPIESLIVRNDARIALDNLMVEPTNKNPSESYLESQVLPVHDIVRPAFPLEIQDAPIKKRNLPVSLKDFGKWTMLAAGILFIASVYFEPVRAFFVVTGLPSFYCCFVPLFILGSLSFIAGIFVERK